MSLTLLAALGGLALVIAACGTGPPLAKAPATPSTGTTGSSSPTTAWTSTTATPPPSPSPSSTPSSLASPHSAVLTAAIAYELAQGVPRNEFQVTGIIISPVDPNWARFSLEPSAEYRESFQGAYGVAHQSGGIWTVLDVGSAEVGCPPGDKAVPASVRASLNLECPVS